MGGGAPPSANEAVEIAPSSTSVASIKRTIFFMGSILRGISLTIFFSREEIRSVRKNARWKTAARRSTDRLNRGLDVSNLWLEGDSALIPDSSLTLAGGKLRLTPALHRGLLRRPTDESGLTPTWNTGKSMLVAGFSQFNKTCFSTKTLLFCSGRRHPRIWRQRRYRFWFRARPGDWSLCGRLSIRRGCGVYWAGRWILRADRPCSACRLGASLLVVMSRTPR
jgi:hypothetical protein